MDAGAHGQQPADVAFDAAFVFREFDLQTPEAGPEGEPVLKRQTGPLAVLARQRLDHFSRDRPRPAHNQGAEHGNGHPGRFMSVSRCHGVKW